MIYLNFGRREMGKTTLAAYLARRSAIRLVFDPRGLFPALPAERIETASALAAGFDRLAETEQGTLVITPDGATQPVFAKLAREAKLWVRERPDVPLTLVVDELRFVDIDIEDFDWLLRCSSRAAVTLIFTAHRPVDASPDLRAIADVWCIFQSTQEHDLKIISERCSAQVATRVQRLAPREFVAWDDSLGTFTVYRDPAAWFLPLEFGRVRTGAASVAALGELQPEKTLLDT